MDLLADEIERFQQLVVDLLEISRPETGLDPLALEPIDIAVLVANVARSDPRNPGVEFAGRPLVTLGDRRRLVRVIANLLDNARRHAGGAVRIAVGVRDGYGRVEIDDDGPGVDSQDRELIFERFARGSHTGGRNDGGGSGLGLALVNQHLRAHRGRCWVEARTGGGSRFVVEIPAQPTDDLHPDGGDQSRAGPPAAPAEML